MTAQALAVRGPGRPRNQHVEAAIVQATLEVLDDLGYGRLSVEAVAARAGVGKATIYRRWPGKLELVVHAIATVTETAGSHRPEGALREDLVAILDRIRRKHETTLAGRLVNRLVGEAPGLLAAYREQVIAPRRERLAVRLRQAADEGELRLDLDPEVLIDALVGPVLYRAMVGSPGSLGGRDYVEQMVDLVLGGASPTE